MGRFDVIVLGAMVGAVTTAALCPLVIGMLRRRAILDAPGERSSHSVPTLRGGGVAPAVGAVIGALVVAESSSSWVLAIAGVSVAYAALGLVDDVVTVPARWRLLVQVGIAVVTASLVAPGVSSGVAVVFVVVASSGWLVAYVNAFNFMDGIDGISAAQVIVAGAAWSMVGVWQDVPLLTAGGLVVAAAALAFLPFNFPRAKVFLGDVGSYFFGAWLAAMVLVALERGITPEMAAGPVLVYLADTGTTLVRRIARRAPWMDAHREHTYQRLLDGGWSHPQVTGFVAATVSLASLLGAATVVGPLPVRVTADLLLVLVIISYLLSPQWQSQPRTSDRLDPSP